jgi:serine/threonine-protein kinase RsbW
MIEKATGNTPDQLPLRAKLSDIAQLPPWIESLASHHAIPVEVQFAIELCLEEAVSNIIRHGYGGNTDCPVIVRFTIPQPGCFDFAVDDEAPLFNPLHVIDMPESNPNGEIRIGGQGVRLLRRFANSLTYEPTSTGNRLTLSFSVNGSAR